MNDELKTQLTAWALDELPPDEQAVTEARLNDLPEAKAYARETREFCTLLTKTLAPATETTLTPDQRAELARQFLTAPAEKVVRFRPISLAWVAGLGAVAAALVFWSGHFLGPTSPTVAVLPASNAPEVARRADLHDQKATDESAWMADFSNPNVQADAVKLNLGRESLAEAEKGATFDTPLFAETDDSDRFGSSARRTSTNFGLNPAPSETQPVDALGAGRNLGFGGERRFKTSEPVTEALDARNESTVPERGAGALPAAAAEPALAATGPNPLPSAAPDGAVKSDAIELAQTAETAPSPTPSAGAPADPLKFYAVDAGLAAKPAEPAGRPLATQTAEGTTLASALSKEKARPESIADLNAGVGLSVAQQGLDGLADFETKLQIAERPAPLSRARGALSLEGESLSTSGGLAGAPAGGQRLSETAATTSRGYEPGIYKESESRHDSFFRYVTPNLPGSTAESYAAVPENPFKAVAIEPLSTFSIDVDTAGYANVRRFLNQGQRPPQPAVRIEELVNYFRYDYPQPEAGRPFSVTVDLADCPWQPQHRLARVGLKGREIAADKRPQSNLVFLLDVSGSMDEPNKLPLVQQSLRLLLSQLTEKDRVAMVTYAGNSGLALDSTNGADRAKIGSAIDRLVAGGSTNGGSGIQLAYDVAQQHFVKEGVNRVILATDGDFNVGVTSQEALQQLITDRAKGGVFLSVLGYGMGNLKDSTMEMLADKGNGNYAYIDGLGEARKVLSEEMSATLVTIAKDVKIQVEFNPAVVRGYRLLGYENRMLAKEDFNDDKKDAGEIGAGHTVTALYELVPVGAPADVPPVDGLKYTPAPTVASAAVPADVRKSLDPAIARETMTVKLRYKAPDGEASQLLEVPVVDKEAKFVEAPADFKFAASVTMFGLLLKDSAHKGNASWDQVRQFALEGKGPDPLGYRGEFIQLVEKARGIAP